MENLVRKNILIDQDQLTRIKTALNARSEKDAINMVLKQFDTELQLSEMTLSMAGKFKTDRVFGEV